MMTEEPCVWPRMSREAYEARYSGWPDSKAVFTELIGTLRFDDHSMNLRFKGDSR